MGLRLTYQKGQTPLSEEEKDGLKIKSITSQQELDEFEQLNIEKAVEWSIHARLKPEKVLTEKFVKRLHKKMYGEVWKWAGQI
jgi:fido (protein-threonine AMPylation protein)